MKIAVIIPFYQNEPGILARSLDSVLRQDLPDGARVEVIVVDDASPVPARDEVARHADTDRIAWRHVRQDNGGPGAARNTGLDIVAADGGFDYVAFLDSDDEWTRDHLRNAVNALEQGYDFYFSDHSRPGVFDSHFAEVDIVSVVGREAWNRATRLGPFTRGFAPHALDHAMLRQYLSQSSTVVMRQATQGQHRFDTELRHAGEDRMMWITAALSGARICLSTRSEIVCGRGLNMFFETASWDSPGIVKRLGSQLLRGQKLMQLDHDASRQWIARDFRKSRRLYSYLAVRNLLKGEASDLATLRPLMKRDPLLPLRMPFLFASFLLSERRKTRTAAQ